MLDVKEYSGITELCVNYCSARITCTSCIDNGENNNCEICGSEKHKSWSDSDGLDPLEEFTNYVLKKFSNKYKTLIYAHYGGKFVSLLFIFIYKLT